MSRATMVVFIVSILLLIYGYLCRLLSIYFFWDSKYFGWIGIVSAMLLLLIDVRISRLRQKQNIFFVRVMVAVLVMTIAAEGCAVVLLKMSGIYNSVVAEIAKDRGLETEIGDVVGFGVIPGVSIIEILQAPASGSLNFTITVEGQEKHRDIEVTIENIFGMDWRVTSMQPVVYH